MYPYLRVIAVALFVFLMHLPQADSTVIKAASCSQTDVQAAINSARDGDTVNVPSGSCTWTSPVGGRQAIHLHGTGYTGANVTQITSGLANTLIFTLTSCSSAPEIDGFLFVDSNSGGSNTQGAVNFGGSCGQIKAHDNKLTHVSGGRNVFFFVHGNIYGVIYNNIMDNTTGAGRGGFFVAVAHSTWNEGIFGDGSWSDVPNYTGTGSNKFLYVEGNTYTNLHRSGFSDMWEGARVVERYNTIVNGNSNSHGFDSTRNGRSRAERIKIGYNNSSTLTDGSGFSVCVGLRGGTGLIYDNDYGSGWNSNCVKAKTYRYIPAYGTNGNTGLSGPSGSGLCQKYTISFLVCPDGTSCTTAGSACSSQHGGGACTSYPGQCPDGTGCNNVGAQDQCKTGSYCTNYSGAHYMCYNANSNRSRQTCCNPDGTMNPNPYCIAASSCSGGASMCIGPVDNPAGNGQGAPCRDAVGRGQDSGLSTIQASEPIFVFGNTGTSSRFYATADAVENQDYYTDQSGGVASGLDSAKLATCTQGYGYWATDTRKLYRCGSGGKSWSVYYTEYACPNPLSGLTGRCNPGVAGAAGYPSHHQR